MTDNLLECLHSTDSSSVRLQPQLDTAALPTIESLEHQVARFQQQRSPELFNRIAAEVMPDVQRAAQRIHARGGFPRFVDRDDLVQYGSVGLIGAIESFNPSRGVLFRTFAARRIEGAMLDGLRTEDPMTRDEREREREITASIRGLATNGNVRPLESEIWEQTTLSEDTFAAARQRMQAHVTVSLDRHVGSEQHGNDIPFAGKAPTRETVVDSRASGVEARVVEAEMWESIGKLLSVRERYVVESHFRSGKQLCDISVELGVSRALVSLIKTAALTKIRQALAAGDLGATLVEVE